MQKSRGLTLIELLVTLAISAMLATMAGPSFVRIFRSNTMATGVNAFMADMRFARSEAVRRGGSVILCRAEDPEVPIPVCANNAGSTGKGWATGWVVFQDIDNNGVYGTGDHMLRQQAAIDSVGSALEATTSSSTTFKFTGTGRLSDASTAVTMTFGGTSFDSSLKRKVCVGASGRVRIAGDGSSTC
jgi:type IV fimbrial biogenesis protein FimT